MEDKAAGHGIDLGGPSLARKGPWFNPSVTRGIDCEGGLVRLSRARAGRAEPRQWKDVLTVSEESIAIR